MKNKFILFPLLFLLPLCPCSVSSIYQAKALLTDENHVVEMGDVIEVAPRTLIHNDEKKVVEGQIILPDGTSKSGKSFTIAMAGVYTVNYRAIFGTEEVNESIYYRCNRNSGDLFISSESNNKPTIGEYSFNTKTKQIRGAKLKLDSKTVFTFDREIDFSSYSFDDPFIEFMVDTSTQGESDLETFTVRLTDVEDANNYVDITITDSGPIDDDGKGCYILAGSNNQFKTGYEFGRLHISKYGTNVGSSFRALPKEDPANNVRLYFDYSHRALYVDPIYYWKTKEIITDLDDKEIYGSSIWEGFKSGRATLSIFANSLSSPSANVIISKACGVDLSQLIFEDYNAPEINIDYAGQSSLNIPKATVGKNYNIFNASIVDDFDKNLKYSVSVSYLDEEKGKTKDISVINNSFKPQKAGTYTIKYLAKDYSNNVATKTIDVLAVNDSQTMTISLPTPSITQNLYSKINLPSINDVIIEGGSGKAKVERLLLDSNNKEIEIEGDVFIPEEIGTYRAYYTATDYIGNISTCSLTIEVEDPGEPVFIGEVTLPRVLVKGHTYTLPSYQGAEVVGGKTVYLDSDIYVNGKKISNNTFVVESTCDISYKLVGQSGNKSYDASIDVVDSGSPLNKAAYFNGNFNAVEEEKDVTLTTDHDSNAVFASVLPYQRLFVKFGLNKDNVNFDELVFKFSDSTNPNISLSFTVSFNGDKTYVTAGDVADKYELAYETETYLVDDVEKEYELYEITFDGVERVLRDINYKELAMVKTDDNGNPFNGFNHGVYLDISLNGVTSQSEVKILTISNQKFGHIDMYDDFYAPTIIFNEKFVNEQGYGENAFLPTVEVFDVLSDAYATVTVKGPDGKYRLQDEDAKEIHTFKLDAFGSYLVNYKATDSVGNTATYTKKIVVYDFVAPEITITGKLKDIYNLNAEISIPSYTVKDNLNDYTLDVFLILPNDEQRLLITDKNGKVTSYLDSNSMVYNQSFRVNANTFRAEQRGRYTLRFVAYDSDFNKSVEELHFTVK